MADIPASTTTSVVLNPNLDSYSGELETAGDHDWFRVNLTAGVTYNFYLSFLDTGSITDGDSVLRLRDSAGNPLFFDDDSGAGRNSALSVSVATGTYFLDVGEFGDNNTGEYSLFLSTLAAIVDELTDGHDTIDIAFLQHRVLGGKGVDVINLGSDPSDALGEQGNDLIIGGDGNERISGGLGNDTIEGNGGNDILFGDAGNDTITGGDGADTLLGGKGNDILDGGPGGDVFRVAGSEGVGDTMRGGTEIDGIEAAGTAPITLAGFNASTASIEVWQGNNQGLLGTSGGNVFNFAALLSKSGLPFIDGGGGNDTIIGSSFGDALRGGSANDTLNGGASMDTLNGGRGKDSLFGGSERDLFDFNAIQESVTGGKRDVIHDFLRGNNVTGDDIDLRDIDAKTSVSGNNAFKFIGKSDFHDKKGELRYEDKGSTVIVQGDTNGDGKADFEILVKVGALGAGDFLL